MRPLRCKFSTFISNLKIYSAVCLGGVGQVVLEHFQVIYFHICEDTPMSAFDILFGKSREDYSIQRLHFVAHFLENPSYYSVPADVDFYPHLVFWFSFYVGDAVYFGDAFFQADTFCNLVEVFDAELPVECYMIDFLHSERGVGQLLGEMPVIGQEDKSCGLSV